MTWNRHGSGFACILVHLLRMLKGGFTVLKSHPGAFVSARVILLLVSYSRAKMSVRCDLVQFGGTPVIVEVARH